MSDRHCIAAKMLIRMREEGHTIGSLAVHLGVSLVLMRRVSEGDTHIHFEEFRKIRRYVEAPPVKRAAPPPPPAARPPAGKRGPQVRPSRGVEAYLRGPAEAHAERSQPKAVNVATLARDLDAVRNDIASLRGLVDHLASKLSQGAHT